jgi:succinate-semialdehyde dehydrogenase/glutarate-semialdehyde dehydrogenase
MSMQGEYALYIDGRFITGGGRLTEPVFDPATSEALGQLPHATNDDLDAAAAAAARAFPAWRDTSPLDRGRILHRAADLMRERIEGLAEILTREQGKVLDESRGELAHAADVIDWCAEEGRRAYGRVIAGRSHASRHMVLMEPVGPSLALTPWNFPALTPSRKLGAGLAAGCTMILKASEETPGTAIAIIRAFHDAGLPPGAANLVFGRPADVSSRLIANPVIRKISFTGSTAVGRHLLKLAADGVKRTTMELGGNAPAVVFADADLDKTIETLFAGKFRNAGQVCVSPARFFVHESHYETFVQGFSDRARALRVGDGRTPGVGMGPLANPRRMAAMEQILADAERHGGHITRAPRPNGPGDFFMPTVVTGVSDDSLLMREETFGPIAPVVPFSTSEELLRRANSVEAGLAGYAFTRSIANAHLAAHGLECGMVGINSLAISAPETPFGGVKQSGHGHEGGMEGLQAFLNLKLVVEA